MPFSPVPSPRQSKHHISREGYSARLSKPHVDWAQLLLGFGAPDASKGPAWRGIGNSTETGHFAKKGLVLSGLAIRPLFQEAEGDLASSSDPAG